MLSQRQSALLLTAWFGLAGSVAAQDVTVESAPPVVVASTPAAGSVDVDPGLKEIRVTFSKVMTDGNFSVAQVSPRSFPKTTGKPRYDRDGKTCVLPVALEPGKVYALWYNNERFKNFKDRDGRSSLPYLLVFRTKGQGARPATPKTDLGAAFDALADDMTRNYSYFELKKIDGPALAREYRPRAVAAGSTEAFVGVLREMLARYRDGHIWVDFQGQRLPTHRFTRAPLNVNRDIDLATLDGVQRCGDFAAVGTLKGGFGAVVLTNQMAADGDSVQRVVTFIDGHRDAPGFLIDLRTANGGDESLAVGVARAFCERPTVYAKSRFRNGPAPTDFGPDQSRTLPAAESPYTKPVVCLLGPGCVSSGEGFAKMLAALPNVTTVGAPTRGSSGNPHPFDLPGLDVTVWYSRWVDLLPDGTPLEGRGVVPEVPVNAPAGAYATADPTWEKGVAVLREKAASRT